MKLYLVDNSRLLVEAVKVRMLLLLVCNVKKLIEFSSTERHGDVSVVLFSQQNDAALIL